MDLVGIVANGSERSRRCAASYGVPLFTDICQLPAGIDAACVAISSELGGGQGTEVALGLLRKGISVLQEHPIHGDELAKLFSTARRHRVVHQMSTLYPHLLPVRQFLAASAALLRQHPAMYVDGACALQLKTSFLDIVGRLLGRLRPWEFQALPAQRDVAPAGVPFRSVQGVIAGVPVSFRLQNQLHVQDPDNHCHVYHHLTLGTSAGSLSLVDTHGPVVWRPRPHIPISIQKHERPEDCVDDALDSSTVTTLAEAQLTWRRAMTEEWPRGVVRALAELRRRVAGEQVNPDPQYYLSLTQMAADLSAAVGPPESFWAETPPRLAAPLLAAVGAVS
jgi:thiazolinyl imide reductase